jgi:hypothetical protein
VLAAEDFYFVLFWQAKQPDDVVAGLRNSVSQDSLYHRVTLTALKHPQGQLQPGSLYCFRQSVDT